MGQGDPCTGHVPDRTCAVFDLNTRYNIFAAVTVKKDVMYHVEAIIIDDDSLYMVHHITLMSLL